MHLHGLGQVIWGVVHKFSGAVSVAQVLSLAILASIPLLSVSSASEQVIQDLLFPDDDKVQREMNQARARKVWNWVRHPKTPAELLIVCLVLRPVMNFMGLLFTAEAHLGTHSVTSLLGKADSWGPQSTVILFLNEKLRDVNNPWWCANLCSFGSIVSA